MTTTQRTILAFVLAAAFAHAPGLAGGFVYDDHRFVVRNEALPTVGVTDALLDPATHTADDDRDVYRPVRTLGHAFDRRRWGLEPFGFRLHSLLAHLVNVALAVLVVRRLLPQAGWIAAWTGAATLALHPVGVEAVGFVSSRGDLYALGASLAALLVVVPADGAPAGRGRLVLGALLAALAALSKEAALVLPAIVAWHAWVVRGTRPGRASAALALGAAGAFVVRQVALAGLSPVQTTPHGGDVVSQAGWALYGLGRTLGHLVAPLDLSVDYPQFAWAADTTSWSEPLTWLVLVVCVLPFALARRAPRLAFATGWFLLAYLPSSSLLVTLRSLVADRYAYPALLPFGVAVGLAASAALRTSRTRERHVASLSLPQGLAARGERHSARDGAAHAVSVVPGPRRSHRFARDPGPRSRRDRHRPARKHSHYGLLGLAAALIVALWWTAATRARSEVFASDRALWTATRAANPDSIPALLGLAAVEADALAAGDREAIARRRELLAEAVDRAPPGTMLEGWALSELGEHLLRIERAPAAAVEPLFQGLQLTRHTRDRGAPEADEVVTAVLLAEAHALLGNHDQADAVLRHSLSDHAGLAGADAAVALLSIKRAQLALHHLQTDAGSAALRRAGQALLDAERHAPDDPLVAAMREAWDAIEARPPADRETP